MQSPRARFGAEAWATGAGGRVGRSGGRGMSAGHWGKDQLVGLSACVWLCLVKGRGGSVVLLVRRGSRRCEQGQMAADRTSRVRAAGVGEASRSEQARVEDGAGVEHYEFYSVGL